jgi:hypothetical protein
MWRKGLAEWDQARTHRQLRAAADVAIYTPGAETGLPLSVAFVSPPSPECWRMRVHCAISVGVVSGLLSLLSMKDPIGSREHILLANILEGATAQVSRSTRPASSRPAEAGLDKLGAFDLETFPAKDAQARMMR